MKYTETLTDKVFNRIYKDVANVLKGKKYSIRNFGDWNAQIIIPCNEFKNWNGGKTLEEWKEKMTEARHGEYIYSRDIANIFTLDYIRGYQGRIEHWADCRKPFVRTDACTALRDEMLALRDRIDEETPYEVKPRGIHYEGNMWFFQDERRNPHHMENGEYFTIDLGSDSLSEWRDMMYQGYSRSDECRLEHQMEREAEIRYEDMIMGTRNI